MTTAERPALIAYDGSEDAREAIARAGALLAPRQAIVVYVWEALSALILLRDPKTLHGPARDAAEQLDAGGAEEAQRVAEQGAEAARAAGFDARAVSREGKPSAWPVITELAKEEDAGCIVVGSRGMSGVRSAVLGSVSTGVLHHAGRPVLIVPQAEAPKGNGPVVIGYDGSEQSARAIDTAGELLKRRDSVVVTAWVPYTEVATTAMVDTPLAFDPAPAEQIDKEIAEGAEETAEKGAALAEEAGLSAAPAAEPIGGNVWATLVAAARSRDASVLVLGSHGRTGLRAVLLGSVSTGAVHHAPCPVLVVPPPK